MAGKSEVLKNDAKYVTANLWSRIRNIVLAMVVTALRNARTAHSEGSSLRPGRGEEWLNWLSGSLATSSPRCSASHLAHAHLFVFFHEFLENLIAIGDL